MKNSHSKKRISRLLKTHLIRYAETELMKSERRLKLISRVQPSSKRRILVKQEGQLKEDHREVQGWID